MIFMDVLCFKEVWIEYTVRFANNFGKMKIKGIWSELTIFLCTEEGMIKSNETAVCNQFEFYWYSYWYFYW